MALGKGRVLLNTTLITVALIALYACSTFVSHAKHQKREYEYRAIAHAINRAILIDSDDYSKTRSIPARNIDDKYLWINCYGICPCCYDNGKLLTRPQRNTHKQLPAMYGSCKAAWAVSRWEHSSFLESISGIITALDWRFSMLLIAISGGSGHNEIVIPSPIYNDDQFRKRIHNVLKNPCDYLYSGTREALEQYDISKNNRFHYEGYYYDRDMVGHLDCEDTNYEDIVNIHIIQHDPDDPYWDRIDGK